MENKIKVPVHFGIIMDGNRLWAESDGKGKGSRFIFELPIE
ncbi:MAG: hypothetical protein NTV81_01095 [Candidatus Komeilibacteria bacterium]|nr:hypothetical protein [Candidatus Komeilibacteria bacterium]